MSTPAAQKAAQAQLTALSLHWLADRLPRELSRVVAATVRNPNTTSDGLLILADALREAGAAPDMSIATEGALLTLADAIAALAPARAEPPFAA